MLTAPMILLGLLVPAVLAAGLGLALSRTARSDPGRGAWRSGLALGAGYVAGHLGILGWPGFPPLVAEAWLPWLVPVALSAAAADEALQARGPLPRWALRTALVGLTLGLVTRPLVVHTWSPRAAALGLPVLAGLALVLWLGLQLVSVRGPGSGAWLTVAVVAAGAAAALLLGGSLALAQMAGALAAAAAGGGLVALAMPRTSLAPAAAAVPTTILTGLLVAGRFYAELHPAAALLLVASPLAGAAVPSAWTEGRSRLTGGLITAAGAALPVVAAVVVAYLTSPPLDPYDPYY